MKNVGDYIHSKLIETTRKNKLITQLLYRHLPPEFIAHISVVGIKEKTLILGVDSPAWLTKLRFLTDELTKNLRSQTGLDIDTIKVRKVDAEHRQQGNKHYLRKKPKQALAEVARRQLRSLAQGTPDERLSKSLERLAGRVDKRIN
ncbi:MAG TPA: hypothetical protein DCZ12_15795 [Gammaproteobacteria bacterium]|nr:hypothetical protein [Gammaproteobacteria bacterium]